MSGHQEARPLRIYFRKRWVQTVHSTVIKYSLLQPDSTFRDPTIEDLEKHRVIVTTLNQSRTIYDLNLGPGKSFLYVTSEVFRNVCFNIKYVQKFAVKIDF